MFNVDSLNLTLPQTPRGNRLLVLPLVKARTGTLIDMEENREQPEKGVVLLVGPGGVGAETGRPIPVEARIGELICYGKYSGLKWEVTGPKGPVKVFVMRDTEVLLAQPPETVDLIVHDGDPQKIHETGLTCEHCPKVGGEAGLDRLQAIGRGEDPDADAALAAERARDAGAAPSINEA